MLSRYIFIIINKHKVNIIDDEKQTSNETRENIKKKYATDDLDYLQIHHPLLALYFLLLLLLLKCHINN